MRNLRPLALSDVPRLGQIDANFTSDRFLDVERSGDGLNVTWRLTERLLDPPFVSTDYGVHRHEHAQIVERVSAGDGLQLIVEDGSRAVAFVDVERQPWRNAAFVWNILIDRAHRRQGLGTQLMQRIVDWARGAGLRAIVCETQTNNIAACRFYQKSGFQLCGVDDHFYSNEDIAVKEVALFWWYEIK
ncbi:MAG TPA: GNAT family N-acetyltransferase [Anaerolineae bacterium]|nr:GNAT family N-acetyltransferase [Anaerolineae bacterium]